MTDVKKKVAEDEELLKNGNYVQDSAEGEFGANACPVGDCLNDDPLEVAAKLDAERKKGKQ